LILVVGVAAEPACNPVVAQAVQGLGRKISKGGDTLRE